MAEPLPPNPSTALARVVVDELVRNGVTDAVLAPGSRLAALAYALADHPGISLHVQLDERCAAFVALGIGRASRRPAAVVTTSGSAVAHLHPAVVEADTGRVPLIAITADRPPELRNTGANQTIDQVAMFGRAVRWAVDLQVAEDRDDAQVLWRSSLARAVAEACGLAGPPGPVQCNLGFREPTVPAADDGRSPVASWSRPVGGRTDNRPQVATEVHARPPAPETISALVERLETADRVVVHVGQGVARDRAEADAIARLARERGWPLLTEATGWMRSFPEAVVHHHHLLGHEGFTRRYEPEVVVRVGRASASPAVDHAFGDHVAHLALDAHGSWHDPARRVEGIFVGDLVATCDALRDALSDAEGSTSAWADDWRQADTAVAAAFDGVLDGHDEPTEPRTARDLGRVLPDGATLVVGSSMPVRDVDRFLRPRAGLEVIANRGASGIDGFVSTAMGVALAGRTPTVGLAGDLSFLHDANGLLLNPDRDVHAVLVVVDNDGGGMFSFLPQARFTDRFERLFATPHGRDLGRLAAFHDIGFSPVSTAAALPDIVGEAIRSSGVTLVHVRTDRSANLALHRELDAAAASAIDATI